MVQLPDSIKPQLAALKKHHFWILAMLVPLLLLPAVFSANTLMQRTIAGERSKIDGQLAALRNIQSQPDHPNDRWVAAIESRTQAIRAEMLAEWRRFWESQGPLRTWPAQLGPEFLAEMQRVEAGTQRELILQNRLRYRDTVADLVRLLPERMGCKELMSGRDDADAAVAGSGRSRPGPGGGDDDLDSPEASLRLDPLVWRSDDQRRLLSSFLWTGEPSTTKVRLAQEELWVYGLFCDAIKQLNAGAKGAFDATITTVEELTIGYNAAEEVPGGRGGMRILWKADPSGNRDAGAGDVEGMPPADAAAEGSPAGTDGSTPPAGRPPNPRFSGSPGGLESGGPLGGRRGGAGAAGSPGEDDAAISPDDALRQWIYVDFNGQPLTTPELETVPDARMVHLVPFTLRVVMDQRKVDRLLRALAGSQIPIDVRQVRINHATRAGGTGGPLSDPGGPGGEMDFGAAGGLPGDQRRRPFDVTLEIRGTVGLATPADEKAFAVPGAGADGGAA